MKAIAARRQRNWDNKISSARVEIRGEFFSDALKGTAPFGQGYIWPDCDELLPVYSRPEGQPNATDYTTMRNCRLYMDIHEIISTFLLEERV